MKNYKTILLLVITFLSSTQVLKAQNKYPVIGKPCPEFTFNNVQHYTSKKASLSDFKGKWLILDFWSHTCGYCLKSFPKMNQIHKDFEGKAEVLSVGSTKRNSYQYTLAAYERLKKHYGISFPVAYDSTTFLNWGVAILPYVVVVDPNGIVKAITVSLNKENLENLMAGKSPELERAYSINEAKIQTDSSFFDEKRNIVSRSFLTVWDPSRVVYSGSRRIYDRNSLSMYATPLEHLYKMAFIGQAAGVNAQVPEIDSVYRTFYPKLILETKDSSYFNYNYATGKGFYCYDLILPKKESKAQLMKYLQDDLSRSFPFLVSVEKRLVPCWFMTIDNHSREKLLTKGDSPQIIPYSNGHFGFKLINQDIDLLTRLLNSYFGKIGMPVFNENYVEANIDINIDAIFSDPDDVKKSLERNGIKLIKGKKEMKAIVVRDKTNLN